MAPAASFAVFGAPSGSDASAFPYVGQIGSVDGSGNFSRTASAVAIDSQWVLSARHIDGNAILLNGVTYNVIEDHADTDSDLRLLKVSGTISNYSQLGFNDAVGQTATFAGFGGSGTGVTGNRFNVDTDDGKLHTANNTLDAIEQIAFDVSQTPWNAYRYDLDDPNATGNGHVAGEGGVWYGDSGGGWFVDGPNGKRLVAISGAIDNPNYVNPTNDQLREFGATGYGTRIVDRLDFIRTYVPQAVPEPGTVVALGAGVAALLRRRKRR